MDETSDDSAYDRSGRRRKQQYPIRIIQDPIVLTETLERDLSDQCCNANLRSYDNYICGRCSCEFFTMPAFIVHKRHCTNEWPVLITKRTNQLDVPNYVINESESNDSINEKEQQDEQNDERPQSTIPQPRYDLPSDESQTFPPSLSPDGVVQIQSALRSLQGQQMVQLQLIQQIYSQLLNTSTDSIDDGTLHISINQSSTHSDCIPAKRNETVLSVYPTNQLSNIACNILSPSNTSSERSPEQDTADIRSYVGYENQLNSTSSNDVSAFDALKSQVINSLKEMEQSVAQQMKEQRKADTYLDKLYRHRCHFCGKIMSSESSLQIHIRSHTGERPYACTICDSRFSTKGNLKVHMDMHKNEETGTFTIENIRVPRKRNFDIGRLLLEKSNSWHQLAFRTDSILPLEPRKRSASMSCLISRSPKCGYEFRDDSCIKQYPSIMENENSPTPDENSKDDEIDTNEDLITESGSMPMDLRVTTTLSNSQMKNPTSFVPNFLTSPFFPTTPFPSLNNLFPHVLSNQSISESINDQSNYFVPPSSLLKMGTLENRTGLNFPPTNRGPSEPLSPTNGADLEEDWESMMEITTTDETAKIKSLVGDREAKVTDPNQCIICHRILSCKSALQMHYRTHTGDRPFRCKICSRAFTTKGNLKTHMGVHRTKPPFRLFHQCPICHKKFNNGIVLQQHIRLHAGHPTDIPISHIQANEIKEINPPTDPNIDIDNPHQSAGQQPSVVQGNYSSVSSPMALNLVNEPTIKGTSPIDTPKPYERTMSVSSSSGGAASQIGQSPSSEKPASVPSFPPFATPPLDLLRNPAAIASWLTRFGPAPFPLLPFSTSPSITLSTIGVSAAQSQSSTDITRSSIAPTPPTSLALPTSLMNPFTPVILPNPPQPSMFGRPNTTCNICFKAFACNSALEIHYRSHTKERPFKCTVCGRGFSTKGNMKQHLLTHKIRDSVISETTTPQNSSCESPALSSKSSNAASYFQESQKQNSMSPPNLCIDSGLVQTSNNGGERPSTSSNDGHFPPRLKREHSPASDNPMNEMSNGEINMNDDDLVQGPVEKKKRDDDGPTPLESIQSMWARTESLASTCASPTSKKPPVLSKHQCQVCYKHFSSSSALAIHMRTHTGERPFCCAACGRSFTTKGNLKVHMGTHSWQHAQSRRGRRIFDPQHSPSLGSGDNQSAFAIGDRSSTATSLEDCSSINSDFDQRTTSPGTEPPTQNVQPVTAASKHVKTNSGKSKDRKMTTPSHQNQVSHVSSPTRSDCNNVLSPNSIPSASWISNLQSISPVSSSFMTSKGDVQNGSFSSNNASMFSSQNFAFMNAFTPPFMANSNITGVLSNTLQVGNGQMTNSNPMQAMLWMWRNVCSVCRHVCSSTSELEDHLKLHLASTNNGNENDSITKNGIIPT